MFSNPVHRAIVTYSDSSTGEIKVRIPALAGVHDVVSLSKIGRSAYNGSWQVPPIGEQIVVTADDPNLSNIFWVQTNPVTPTSTTDIEADVAGLTTDVAGLSTDLSALTTRISALESYRDAFLLGIFR
jgi:phage baseplate assembly protein gpV